MPYWIAPLIFHFLSVANPEILPDSAPKVAYLKGARLSFNETYRNTLAYDLRRGGVPHF